MLGLKRLLRYGGFLVVILISLVLTAGCSSAQEVALGEANDRTQVELEKGQTLAITLNANPSTGYGWARDAAKTDEILVMVGEPTFKSKSRRLGGGGTEMLRFRADHPGTTTLKLVYHRLSEKEAQPAETYTLHVTVR